MPFAKKVVALLAIGLVGLLFTSVACSETTPVVEEPEIAPAANLVFEPSSAQTGATIAIYAAGLPASAKIQLIMVTDTGTPGLTGMVTPVPQANESGAFAGTLSLKGLSAGVYTIQLLLDGEIVTTAPLEVTEPV